MESLNGMAVIARNKTAIYLRIPREHQVPTGGCSCEHCKKDPSLAMWDTLVISLESPDSRKSNDYAYTVHMPDAQVQEFKDYCRKNGK